MNLKKIKLITKVSNKNISLTIYDLNFGVLYNINLYKNYFAFNTFKSLIIEYLLESGILKGKKRCI